MHDCHRLCGVRGLLSRPAPVIMELSVELLASRRRILIDGRALNAESFVSSATADLKVAISAAVSPAAAGAGAAPAMARLESPVTISPI